MTGDFSDYRNVTTGALVPIYDPWTQCGITNPGNVAAGAEISTTMIGTKAVRRDAVNMETSSR